MDGIKTELTLEQVKAMFFDDRALTEPAYKLYRMDGGDNRFYYTLDDKTGDPKFYTSWTSLIHNNMPTNQFLIDWMIGLGKEESEAYKNERASYGTFMHSEICDFMIAKKINYDTLPDRLLEWQFKTGINTKHWYWEMRKDLLSFQQFAFDVKLEPFAIEIALASKCGAAGSIDLVCKMDIEEKGFFGEVYKSGDKKGEPKESKKISRVRAIVDFKSGKKGFHDAHVIQLHGYMKTWNENFPNLKIDRVFNWAPSDWRDNPGYKLEEQTDKWVSKLLEPLIQMNKIRVDNDNIKPKNPMIIGGIAEFGTDVASNYKKVNIVEYIKSKKV